VFSKDEEKIIRKIYLADQEGRTPENVWSGERYGTTRSANNHLKEIFDGRALFDTVKPVELIQVMLDLFHNENDFIIVDFFAGSASTADAVYRANAKDGGTRKWIMVQLPEQIEDGSEAKKAGYSNIAKLARERIKRSSEAMAKAHSKMNIDLGFRAFALNRSCFKTWDGEVDNLDDRDLIDRISSHAQHIDPSAKPEEILFELLLKDGFPLTVALQRFEVAGKEVFSIAEGALLICLDRDLTQELMDALAEMEPARVICLDAGFKGNDQLKANAVQTFKARARTKETAIEFRTV
jgi:adenine-specific DNA-methyltransferase